MDERATWQCGRPGSAARRWTLAAVERVRSNVVMVPGEGAAGGERRSHRPRALAGFWYCCSRESSRTH